MANTKTLADLRTGAIRRADMANSDFISEDEADGYVNDALSELHDLLVTLYRDYFQATDTITLVANQEAYALPTDFYKLSAAFYLSGAYRYRLSQFMLQEFVDYQNDRLLPLASGEHLLYRLLGNQIYFAPKPTSGGTVEIWYVPEFTRLTAGTDTVSYAIANGWEEYAETRAAIAMLGKEQSDASHLLQALGNLTQRITFAAQQRDIGQPQRVTDVYLGRGRSPYRRRLGSRF